MKATIKTAQLTPEKQPIILDDASEVLLHMHVPCCQYITVSLSWQIFQKMYYMTRQISSHKLF